MSEKIAKIILETEFKTTGDITPTTQKISELQKATQAAQGDTLKLIEAEKQLGQAAAQAGQSVSQQTKKQSEFTAAVGESGKAMNQIAQSQSLKKSFDQVSPSIKATAALVDEFKKKISQVNDGSGIEKVVAEFSQLGRQLPESLRADFIENIKTLGQDAANELKAIIDTPLDKGKLGQSAETLGKAIERPTQRLRELKRLINTTEDPALLKAYQEEAGKLQDQLGDTNDLVRALASDTFFTDTLVQGAQTAVSAFTAFQGALTLVTDDQEELAKAAQKAQGALALLQGTQTLLNEIKKSDNIITRAQIITQRAYAVAVGQSTGAMRIFRTVLFGLGIGAVVAGIVLLVENWDKLTSAIGNSNKEAQKAIETQRKLAQATLDASNAALESANNFNDYLTSTGQSEEQSLRTRIESLNKYIQEQNDLDRQLTENLGVENLKRRKLNQEQYDSEVAIRNEARKNAQKGLVDRNTLNNQLTKLLSDDSKKEKDIRLNELNEKERHETALAKLDFASNEDLLRIQLDYAQQRLDLLGKMKDVDKVQIKQAENNITEISEALNNIIEGSISQLQEKVSRLQTLSVQAVLAGTPDAELIKEQLDRARKELKAAEDFFGETEFFQAGSLNALNKSAQELEKVIQSLPEGEELRKRADELKTIQKEIADLEAFINPEDRRATPAELLNEEERYQQAILDLQESTDAEKTANEIKFQKERINLLKQAGSEAREIEIEEAENTLSILEDTLEKQRQLEKQAQKERFAERVEFIRNELELIADSVSQVIDYFQQQNDRLTQLQEQRVDEAAKIADRGNSQILEIEQKRLDALNEKNRKYAEAQAAIAQIMLVANAAVAISKAAAEGGVAAPFTIAATLIALAAGFAQARAQANAASASFADGGFTGKGGKKDKTGQRVAGTVHENEFVFDRHKTKKWRPIFDEIHASRLEPGQFLEAIRLRRKPLAEAMQYAPVVINDYGEVVDAINSQPGFVFNLNSKGIISITERHLKTERKRKFLGRR